MSLDVARPTVSYRRVVVLCACVVLVAITLTWTFLGMRSVMDVGGACADGGPYVSAQPCPDGSWMLAVAIPVMVISSMVGSLVASGMGAPILLFPMWGILFGSLGWNFLEYGALSGDLVWGWIICGVVFELMALPVLLMVPAALKSAFQRGSIDDTWTPPGAAAPRGAHWWWPAFAALGTLGCILAVWSYYAWS